MLQVKLNGVREIMCSEVPELDPPRPVWATIDVAAIGICGSELHVYLGENPVLSPPRIQGHEFSGTIKNLGSPSEQFKIGDRVTVNPVVSCGDCYHCRGGHKYLCDQAYVIGGEESGAFGGQVYVPMANIVPIQDSLSMTEATLIEPSAVAYHTVGDLHDKNVLIIGQGTIGLLCLEFAKLKGNKVIAMDLDDHCLQIAKELGADLIVNSKTENAEEKIKAYLGNQVLDAVIDAVSNPSTMNTAIDLVKKGGEITMVGIPKGPYLFKMVEFLCKEITLKTSYLYSEEDFLAARDAVESGRIQVKPLISRIFPFAQAAEAFEYKLNTPSIKVVVENDK